MKTFFFMAGLPRSGATVLSTILNQNPDFYVPPASPMFRMYLRLANCHEELENVDFLRNDDIANVYYTMSHNFYAKYDAKYIIDKNLNWVSPLGVEIISKFINQNVKIICPVRPIAEILTSFDTIINANDISRSNPMDQQVVSTSFPDKSLADRRADYLMQPNNDIYNSINWMTNIWKSEFKSIMHIIDYNDFVAKPKETLSALYDFLEIEKFEHSFDNIEDKLGIKQDSVTGIYDLHKVYPKLERRSVDPTKVLLPETIERYSGLEFWRA